MRKLRHGFTNFLKLVLLETKRILLVLLPTKGSPISLNWYCWKRITTRYISAFHNQRFTNFLKLVLLETSSQLKIVVHPRFTNFLKLVLLETPPLALLSTLTFPWFTNFLKLVLLETIPLKPPN